MIRRVLCLQAAMILFAGSAYAQGKPSKCTAPRLQWELVGQHPITGQTSGITDGDGKGTYKDGTDGLTAVIEFCAVGKDATLGTGDRKMTFALLGIDPPNWNATGSAFLRIGNILGDLHASQEGEFTTWMTTNPPSLDRKYYKFRMVNPNADFQKSYPEDVNQPYVTAKVKVYHCPAINPAAASGTCAGLTKETWFVYPDPAFTTYSNGTPASYRNVGTLLDVTKPHATVIVGQFEVPFYFVISIQ